jgi:hypothetical protein
MPDPVVTEKCPTPGCGRDLRAVTRTSSGLYFVDLHCDWCGYADYDEKGGV